MSVGSDSKSKAWNRRCAEGPGAGGQGLSKAGTTPWGGHAQGGGGGS